MVKQQMIAVHANQRSFDVCHFVHCYHRKLAVLAGMEIRPLGVCWALVVEARIRLCADRFSTIRRSIVILWTKNRRKYGPHRRIRRPANQSLTDS